jgi:hypothetical protein
MSSTTVPRTRLTVIQNVIARRSGEAPRLDQPGGDGQDILGQVILDAQHVPAQLVVVTGRHLQLD